VSVPHPALEPDHLLASVHIDATTRGFPVAAGSVPIREVGAQGWVLSDLPPPVLVLRAVALAHNLALMAAFCERADVDLAPHGKTSMSPQIWARQLEAGAWGLTAATAAQARVMRAVGVRRILLANELVDRSSIDWAAGQLSDPSVELLCYVDSVRGVELLDEGLARSEPPRPLRVLLELGYPGGRTGRRTVEEAVEVADRVRGSGRLELAGVAGFEGTICHDRSPACLERVRDYLDRLRELSARLLEGVELEHAGFVLSAGGSAFFDLAVERLREPWASDVPIRVVLRSGCYVTHDSGLYERVSPFSSEDDPDRRFRPAIEVWGSVLSRPERDLAILGLGRRDVPFDQDLPEPRVVRTATGRTVPVDRRLVVTELNDQHAYCRVRGNFPLEVGDLVACGISHPCTAFDRWRIIPVLDEDDRVVEAVATFF
jgi:D-serine deaminase-like pyridoxal phosphate-dependent protein